MTFLCQAKKETNWQSISFLLLPSRKQESPLIQVCLYAKKRPCKRQRRFQRGSTLFENSSQMACSPNSFPLTEATATSYFHPIRHFRCGLRGAFRKPRGLNHFQPVMVLSVKHRFLLLLFNALSFMVFNILSFETLC
jgi:hypothetical protein